MNVHKGDSMNVPKKLSRREFFSIAGRYGTKAALFASATVAAGGFVPALGEFVLRDARAQASAKYKLRFGSGISPAHELHLRYHIFDFVKLVEQKSDGEVVIQIIDKGQACFETTCGDRVINGILDMGNSSPQNLGSVTPYAIALDWPFLWRDRTGYHNFLFSKESNKLYRDVMRNAYGIVPLYGSGEMRNIMMGLKYVNQAPITSPSRLQGAKIRITNSEMIANFAVSLKMNPIPLAFSELLEGLKSGVVDAAETWSGAATGFGMHTVLTQDIAVEFSPGFGLVFISAKVFDKFPDKIKMVFLEAAWETMQIAFKGVAEVQNKLIGNGPNPAPDSAYVKSNVKYVKLTEAQRSEFERMGSVKANPHLYSDIRKRLDGIARTDVLGGLQEFESKVSGKPLQPTKWWV